jgi:2-aminoethylphosphonate-pyruvate transaminase
MGVRLKDRGKLTPKGCMRLGEKSIVEESVLRLLRVGIERIVIVTGHLAEQFEHLQIRYGQAVQLVHNPHFADSGSMYSLCCAWHCVDAAFLLLESDLVYECRALTICLEYPSDNVVLLSGFSRSSDEVFVETRDGRLVEMSKNRERLGTEVSGEMVGICKISRSLFAVMHDAATKHFRTTHHIDYETDCLVAAARLMPVSCPVVEDLIWCEIDDESHLARARNLVYPAVQENDVLDRLRFPSQTTAATPVLMDHRDVLDTQEGPQPKSTQLGRDTLQTDETPQMLEHE